MNKKKFRILLVNHSLASVSGSEKNAYITATHLKELGHTVECFSLANGITSKKLEKNGIKRYARRIPDFVSYHIIFAGHKTPTSFIVQKFPNTPVVLLARCTYCKESLTKEIIDKAKHLLVVCDDVKDFYINKVGVDPSKVTVLNNGVDLEELRPNPNYHFQHPIKFAQLTRVGGDRMLGIENGFYLASRFPGSKYFIGMSSGHYDRLPILADRFHVDTKIYEKVWNTGKIIHQADVVFGTSRGILEGLACGKICIVVSRTGGGLIVTENNFKALNSTEFTARRMKTDSIEVLKSKLTDIFNDSKYIEMGKYNRQLAEKFFDNRERVKKLEEIFKKCLES